MSTAAFLRPPPSPPNDPTSFVIDGLVGWRIASVSSNIGVSPGDCAITLQPTIGNGSCLTEPYGSFGGLVPPSHVCVDGDGTVWLLDRASGALRRFDPCTCAFVTMPCIAGIGTGARELAVPGGIATCCSNLLVIDTGKDASASSPAAHGRVLVFARHALALRAIWRPPTTATTAPWHPVAAACDQRGRAFVADPANGMIHVFDRVGTWRTAWKGFGAVAAIAIDCLGRVYTFAIGDSDVRISSGDGKQIGQASDVKQVAPCFPPPRIARDLSGSINMSAVCPTVGWFDQSGAPTTAPVPVLPSFATSGTWVTEALDSGIASCQWHRIIVGAQIPTGTGIAFSTYTSEIEQPIDLIAALPATSWSAVPPIVANAKEALILSPPGRYLWLRATLSGKGHATPRLNRVDIEYPRIRLRRYLPAAFAPDPVSADFTDRLLAIFDQGLRSVESEIDNAASLFDPRSAPAVSSVPGTPDMLTWLASWIGVSFDRTWPVARRRRFLRAAARQFGCRGTVSALRRAILLYLRLDDLKIDRKPAPCAPRCAPSPRSWSLPPLILEHWKVRRWLYLGAGRLGDASVLWGQAITGATQLDQSARLGVNKLEAVGDPQQAPFAADAYAFTAFIPGRFGRTARDRAAVGRMLANETPAYVNAVLRFVQPRMRIGIQASIGFDAVVGCWPEGVMLGSARLGRATVLGPKDNVDPVPRVGQTTRVGTTMRVA
jgi:phage tail-like protein